MRFMKAHLADLEISQIKEETEGTSQLTRNKSNFLNNSIYED